jgi:hypothetical protein
LISNCVTAGVVSGNLTVKNITPKNDNKSPCIKQCRLDENKVCVGCGRTIVEIKQYGNENKAA